MVVNEDQLFLNVIATYQSINYFYCTDPHEPLSAFKWQSLHKRNFALTLSRDQ